MVRRLLFFLVISIFLVLPFLSASLSVNLPTQNLTTSEWVLTKNTEIGYTSIVLNKNKQQTLFCIYQDNATKLQDIKRGDLDFKLNDISQVKLKAQQIKKQDTGLSNNKFGYCYNSKNGDNKIHFGTNSIVYEWINNTFQIHPTTEYSVDPFQITIWDCNGNQFSYPDVNWTTSSAEDNRIVFYPMLGNTNLSCIRFRTNTLESQPLVIQTANQFQGEIKTSYHLSFEDFEAKNNITSRNITIIKPTLLESFFDTFPFIWRMFSYQADTNYYEIEYRGVINDLDPSLELTLNTAYPDAITFNQTEGTSSGARLSASVLSMDFNSIEENNTATTMYVKDNSIYNNFGTINMTGTRPTYNATGGVSESGAYQFNGVNNAINGSSNIPASSNSPRTVSVWFNAKSIPTSSYSMVYSSGTTGCQPLDFLKNYDVVVGYTNKTYFHVNGNLEGVPAGGKIGFIGNVSTNSWNNAVIVYDGTSMYGYLNGVLRLTDTRSLSTTASTYILGNTILGCANYYFNGSIDNVQIFNRALTASEVLDLYNGTNANKTIKYSTTQGDFTSGVFYNSTSTYWNISLATADTTARSGIVNTDNSINLSNPNLVSYFPLDNGYNDVVGGRTATCGNLTISTTCPNNYTGLSSDSIKFDGTQGLNYSSPYSFMTQNENYSVSLWVYIDSVKEASHGPVFVNTLSSSNRNYIGMYGTSTSNMVVGAHYSSGATSYAVSGVPTNQAWNHLVYIRNGSVTYLYLNGVNQTGTNTLQGAGDMPGLFFGVKTPSATFNNDRFNNSLDEVLVYNKSLSAEEVYQLYKSGLSQHANTNITLQARTANTYNTTDSNLIGLWTFNNESYLGENGTLFVDLKGLNNGTCPNITNCPSFIENEYLGKSIYFNGIIQGVDLNNVGTINTLSLWFKPYTAHTTATAARGFTGSTTSSQGIFFGASTSVCLNELINIWNNGASARTCVISDSKLSSITSAWHHIALSWNGTQYLVYYDNVLMTRYTLAGTQARLNFTDLGVGYSNYAGTLAYFNGTIDEMRIYSRSLNADEISNLYQLGSYHISDWTNWTNQSLITDGVSTELSTASKFMQYKANFNTNTTDISPYVLSYNVTPYTKVNYAPQVTWVSQTPADINTQIIFENDTKIVYSIVDDDTVSGLNYTNVTFFWKVNTTTSNAVQFYLNGSSYQALAPTMVTPENFFNRKSQWTNVSENWTQTMNANEFLPATYNINEFIMETTPHNIVTLTNTDDSILVELLNINNETQYNFFELMVNSTANAAPLQFYYCNSSYNLASKVTTSPHCHLFNTLLNTQTFNHNHTNYTQHQTISMFINTTTGTQNSLKVTPRGYFVARMSGGTGDWYVYNIPNTARLSASKTSNTAGTTWTNQTYSFDSHLHQFYNDSYLRYYACANDIAGLINCSSISTDSLELGNLPPTSPIVYNPPAGLIQEDNVIVINWTAAESPNGYEITHYNVSLWNMDNTFNRTLIANTSNLSYIWNGQDGLDNQMYGTWYIQVQAYDINGLSSIGISGNFTRLADATQPFIEILKPIQDLWQDLVFSVKLNATDANSISSIWYNFNNGLNYTYTSETTKYLTNGEHTIYAYANDSYNNINWTSRVFSVGNVQSNQSCPLGDSYGNWSQIGSLPNGTIICSYTNFSVGPQGPEGPQGPQGPQGIPGVNGTSGVGSTCEYKRYGYYNLNLPWFRQEGCI